jgi:hypothetical protein
MLTSLGPSWPCLQLGMGMQSGQVAQPRQEALPGRSSDLVMRTRRCVQVSSLSVYMR